MPARFTDWPSRLAAFVEARRHRPFAWGSNDCCLLAADAIEALTGADLAAAWRGTYSSALEAARIARRGGLAAAGDPFGVASWARLAGLSPVAPAYAGRGDIVAVAQRRALLLGIVVGREAIIPGVSGLVFAPRAAWRRAWRIA